MPKYAKPVPIGKFRRGDALKPLTAPEALVLAVLSQRAVSKSSPNHGLLDAQCIGVLAKISTGQARRALRGLNMRWLVYTFGACPVHYRLRCERPA